MCDSCDTHVTSSGWRLGLAVSYLGRKGLKRMRFTPLPMGYSFRLPPFPRSRRPTVALTWRANQSTLSRTNQVEKYAPSARVQRSTPPQSEQFPSEHVDDLTDGDVALRPTENFVRRPVGEPAKVLALGNLTSFLVAPQGFEPRTNRL